MSRSLSAQDSDGNYIAIQTNADSSNVNMSGVWSLKDKLHVNNEIKGTGMFAVLFWSWKKKDL